MAKLGPNPGVYIEVIPKTFEATESAGGTTSGLFFLFSPKGEDNKPVLVTSPKRLLEKFGNPNLKRYGQGLYNAYNFVRVSSNAYVFRALPVLEDINTEAENPNYVNLPASFANVVLTRVPLETDEEILTPISLIPKEFKTQPKWLEAVYKYETDAKELMDDIGAPINMATKSTSILVEYNDEYTDILAAGLFASKDAHLDIPYYSVREKVLEYNLFNSAPNKYIESLGKIKYTLSTDISNYKFYLPKYEKVVVSSNTTSVALNEIDSPNILVYVNGELKYPDRDYTWDNTNKVITFNQPLNKNDIVVAYQLFQDKKEVLAPGESVTIPKSEFYTVYNSNGEIDTYNGTYKVVENPYNNQVTITNTSNKDIIVEHCNTVGSDNYYIVTWLVSTTNLDEHGNLDIVIEHNIDKMALDLGFGVYVYLDDKPIHAKLYDKDPAEKIDINGNRLRYHLTAKGVGNPGEKVTFRYVLVLANDPEAVIKTKPLFGVFGKGRGGYYNKLAFEITRNYEVTDNKFLPREDEFNLQVYIYDKTVGSYIPTADNFTFSIYPDGVDDFGQPYNIEQVINTYGNDILVFYNREAAEQLKLENASGNYVNRLQQLWHEFTETFTDKQKMRGGAEGNIRRLDGTIEWTNATSVLIKAIQGLYDNLIYNTDDFNVDLVFDANYPDAVKKELINYCELREDCLAILDAPKFPNLEAFINWFDNSFATSTYRASMFVPHVKVFSQFDNDYVWMAPSYLISYKAPYVDRYFGFYEPISGKKRGVLNFDIQKYSIPIQLTENSEEQRRLVVRNVNPIGRKQGVNVIWGNYTIYKIPSALQSYHAVRITNAIYKDLKQALSNVQWDLLKPTTIRDIKNVAVAVLSNYANTAIEPDFKVVVEYNEYDRQRRLARVYVDFKPYLELRRVVVKLNVK